MRMIRTIRQIRTACCAHAVFLLARCALILLLA
jgi:hypothetical protein